MSNRESRFPLAVALACALPFTALAQYSSSTTSTTTTGGGTQTTTTLTTAQGNTTITGGLGSGTVSASGVVVNPAADQVLLSQVVSELASDPAMTGAQIDVQVVGGRVTLNGIARTQSQVETAKGIAATVAGGAANVASNLTSDRQ